MKKFHVRSLTTDKLLLIIGTIGAIIFSQGISFAWWNDFQGTRHFINLHALLLAAGGIGMVLLTVVFRRMITTIRQLEQRVAELTTTKP